MEAILKLIAIAFGIALLVAFIGGVYWALWVLWCWVLPQLWADGPANLIRPNFWLFAGAWFLLTLVGRAVFGRSSPKD